MVFSCSYQVNHCANYNGVLDVSKGPCQLDAMIDGVIGLLYQVESLADGFGLVFPDFENEAFLSLRLGQGIRQFDRQRWQGAALKCFLETLQQAIGVLRIGCKTKEFGAGLQFSLASGKRPSAHQVLLGKGTVCTQMAVPVAAITKEIKKGFMIVGMSLKGHQMS